MDSPDSDKFGHDLRVLQEEIGMLRYQLDEATSKIMSLQHTTDQITDDEIRKGFSDLQESIQKWIYDIEQDLKKHDQDFGRTLLRKLDILDEDEFEGIRDLGLYDESNHGQNKDWMMWIGNLNTCIYIVLSRLFWEFLHTNIFEEKFPIGASKDTCATFGEILSAMRASEDKRDVILTASNWKSDTITALTKTMGFQRHKTDRTKQLSKELEKDLAWWIDHEIPESNNKKLEIDVLEGAVNLHQQISRSSYEYLIMTPKLVRGQTLDETEMSSWTLRDIVKWRSPYGEASAVFHCLYPGIYRIEAEGEENVSVAPPVILVYANTGFQPPLHPQPQLQSQQTLHQSAKKIRNSRRSPERSNYSFSRPAPPTRRPSTSVAEEGVTNSTTRQVTPDVAPRWSWFPKKRPKDKEPARDHYPDSRDDSARQDSRAKALSSSSRNQPLRNPDRGSKSNKSTKSRPHQRVETVSEPSQPSSTIEPLSTSEACRPTPVDSTPVTQDLGQVSFSPEYSDITESIWEFNYCRSQGHVGDLRSTKPDAGLSDGAG